MHSTENFAQDITPLVLAVSDGASESFDSRTWARLLVARYMASQEVDPAWLQAAVADYDAVYAGAALPWSQQAAYDRGSFATLLGVIHDAANDSLEVLAIGDTTAVLLDGAHFFGSYPIQRAAEFEQRPQLLSTLAQHNAFVSQSGFIRQHSETGNVTTIERKTVLTDAFRSPSKCAFAI